MKLYQMKCEDISILANQVKQNLLINMKDDGIISQEQLEELITTYMVSISDRPETWGSYIAQKLGLNSEEGPLMVVSKLISKKSEETSEEESK